MFDFKDTISGRCKNTAQGKKNIPMLLRCDVFVFLITRRYTSIFCIEKRYDEKCARYPVLQALGKYKALENRKKETVSEKKSKNRSDDIIACKYW